MDAWRQIAVSAPRNPGQMLLVNMPAAFADWGRVRAVMPRVLDVMDGGGSFAQLVPLDHVGYAATYIATLEAAREESRSRGVSMLQAYRALICPEHQIYVCPEALHMMRQAVPGCDYGCTRETA